MQVSVINAEGKVIARGQWDGKRVDGRYAKVNDQLYNLAYVYQTAHEAEVVTELKEQVRLLKEANDAHFLALVELGKKYRAR